MKERTAENATFTCAIGPCTVHSGIVEVLRPYKYDSGTRSDIGACDRGSCQEGRHMETPQIHPDMCGGI